MSKIPATLDKVLPHAWRFARLWVVATVAQVLAGSVFNSRVACIAAAVGLVETLYRIGVPSATVKQVIAVAQASFGHGHAAGLAQAAVDAAAHADVPPPAVDAADEPPLVNGQPQPEAKA